jgi:hypothetical protein
MGLLVVCDTHAHMFMNKFIYNTCMCATTLVHTLWSVYASVPPTPPGRMRSHSECTEEEHIIKKHHYT